MCEVVKIALLVIGPICELGGIVLVGWPDLVPQAERLAGWLNSTYQSAVGRLRRLLGLQRVTRLQAHVAGEGNVAARLSVGKSVNPHATLEQKVEFLLTRDQEAQRDVNELRAALEDAKADLSAKAEALRTELIAHVAEELRRAHERYRPLRFAGIMLLAAGLLMVSIAAFL